MPNQKLLDTDSKFPIHQKRVHCLVLQISKSINMLDPEFMEVL